MSKRNLLVMGLLVFFLESVVTACVASAPSILTATPLPSAAPIRSPSPLTATPSPSVTPTRNPAQPPVITGTGSFFALSVGDIEESAKWYSEKLGLKIVMRPLKTNQSIVIVLEGDGLIVELIQHDGAVSLSEIAPAIQDQTLIHGIVKAGVIVDDFNQTMSVLRERKVPIAFGPFPATADQRANVIIQDNEGNLIQFFGK